MRILFLNPPFLPGFSRTSRSPGVSGSGTLYYPFWLAYAAGVAEAAGCDVLLLDAVADRLDKPAALERVCSFKPDLVVLDTSTPSIYSDAAFANSLKERLPNAFILLVGTHPAALPEETLAIASGADGCAIGEYDYTVRDLAAALAAAHDPKTVSGLVLRNGDGFIHTQARPKIANLDELPFVSSVYKKFLQPENYFFAAAKNPMLMIITGRGCPFHCFYCVYPQTFHSHKYRQRSPENVVAEFEYIAANFPQVREVAIEDDCFTANPARVRAICELLIKRGNRLSWYCDARGDVDFETLRLMKAAGCRLVITGFESSSQEALDAMGKGQKIENYRRFAKDARAAGLLLHGCMMCGTPGDTPEIQEKNFAFAKELGCDSMQFYPLYPYPGTKAYEWARDNGFLLTEDYSQWLRADGSHNCVMRNAAMDAEQMKEICGQNMRRYHLRPAYLARKLLQALRDADEGRRSLRGGWTFLKKQFGRKQ